MPDFWHAAVGLPQNNILRSYGSPNPAHSRPTVAFWCGNDLESGSGPLTTPIESVPETGSLATCCAQIEYCLRIAVAPSADRARDFNIVLRVVTAPVFRPILRDLFRGPGISARSSLKAMPNLTFDLLSPGRYDLVDCQPPTVGRQNCTGRTKPYPSNPHKYQGV
jgi:hypothetical protein